MTTSPAIAVLRIDRLELRFEPRPWPFAEQRSAEIDAHFAARQAGSPALWNGRILMLYRHTIDGAVFRGSFMETDYASFLAWQDWGRPEAGAKDCFAQAALRSSDGAFLLGIMGPRTSYPGRIYFPSGVPDPSDIVGETVDLDASVWRELGEETGLTPADVEAEPGWHAVLAGQRLAQIKIMQAAETAEALRDRILRALARQAEPELSDVRIVRSARDFDPMMQDFVIAFLDHVWR